MKRRTLLQLACGLPLCSCRNEAQSPRVWRLFEKPQQALWRVSSTQAPGVVAWQDSVLNLGAGAPMTGIHLPTASSLGIPWERYSIQFEARRVSGSDFFATLTFPIHEVETAVSLVLGGWGGSLVGISCIDGYDASENTTTCQFPYQNGTWYRLKIEVLDRWLKVWQDDRPLINTNLLGRQLSLRGGEIIHCLPLGFASYMSEAEIRNFEIQEILP